ncbi:MAG TPA: GvpL/GvpF family gas vesicle protein [Candidatus Angelobacter sp.]|nr:GvpL/GvpF family gas vesicle protein [Candidatus Angelobacter sp.]
MANRNRKLATENALYLYGVSRGMGKTPPGASSPGIDGVNPVKPLVCGDFLCWVSNVDQASFTEALERNMENLEWLALHSVRHQQVVGEVAARMAIVPARFGTVFSGEAALRANVTERSKGLAKVFNRVADSDEWGVKVFAEKQAGRPTPSTARSGKEYLRQKAAEVRQRPERSDPELQNFVDALGKVASESAPSGKVSGAQPSLLWQATFLVPRSRQKEWDKVLSGFVERWSGVRRIELNGPWPPYSFVADAD